MPQEAMGNNTETQELGPEDPLAVTTRERYAKVRAARPDSSAN